MGDALQAANAVESLKQRLGEVIDQIFAQGLQAGEEAGYRKGLAEGGRIERERIRAVRAQALPGHEALIEELANDGVTTGSEAAQRILAAERGKPASPLSKIKKVLAAEKAKATDRLNRLTGDKPHQPLPAAEPHGDPLSTENSRSFEERCRADWDREPGLRAEFGTLETYLAFTRQREAGMAGR
jgi:hypothetical protein